MQQIIKSFPDIDGNLGFDLDLLTKCNEEGKGPYLRFWEQPDYCVVLGKSRKAEIDVRLESCKRDGIPICRRESGGGTVLLGPGCLCYTLVFPLQQNHPPFGISQTNRYVMVRHRDALQEIIVEKIEIQGITDLTIDGKKFSGNAQKRKSRAVLFHGTFLFNFDLDRITHYLPVPPETPEYRQNKSHLQFLTNIKISRERLMEKIALTWET
jgi:lipoate---protein ligase